MLAPNRPLMSLTAADLMSQAVVMVPQDMSLEGAARLLSQAQVSGAPVVDTEGRCVGVLSATDFVHRAQKGVRPGVAQECVCSSWQIVDTECLPREAVLHHMTKDPVTVTSAARIGELAQMMLDAHIHRVIVVDKNRRPIGIVSSTDILAAVAQAARAAEAAGKSTRTPVASA
jgi:CBS domain-containing protein